MQDHQQGHHQEHHQGYRTVAPPPMPRLSGGARIAAARDFADELARRRTVREYAPAPDCRVPDIQRLALDGYASFL